jgi:hypothetical protein
VFSTITLEEVMTHIQTRIISVLLFVLVMLTTFGDGVRATPIQRTTPPKMTAALYASELLVSEQFNEWTLGGGMLYWAYRCALSPDAVNPSPQATLSHYYLRRKPINGGEVRTLVTPDHDDCRTFLYMTADDSGVYYFNEKDGQIEKIPLEAPDNPPQVLAAGVSGVSTELTLDGTHLYWGTSGNAIERVAVDGGVTVKVVNTSSKPKDLVIHGSFAYWVDADGLWSANTQCTSLPCSRNPILDHGGTSLVVDTSGAPVGYPPIYWVDDGSPRRIRRLECNTLGECSAPALYDTPHDVGQLIGIDQDPLRSGISHLSWTENVDYSTGRVQRMPIEGSTAEIIAESSGYVDERLAVDSIGLYFADLELDNNTIERLSTRADALEWDLAFDGWEVTQGIQNLNNEVPLIADKTTYVRVYGRHVNGSRANGVEAHLYGWRDGKPLPGSPLQPVNGVLALGRGSDREDRIKQDGAWLFHLPDSWIETGVTILQAVVDPREVYFDTDRTNNSSSSSSFTFINKNPLCLDFVPVRTYWPNASTDNPHFGAVIDLLERMWPASRILPFNVDFILEKTRGCPMNPFGSCPFEIDVIEDLLEVRNRLLALSFFSDVPAACGTSGLWPISSQVHQVSMYHNDVVLAVDRDGLGMLGFPVVQLKLPDASSIPPPATYLNWPRAGLVLAHELGHNRGRYHVDCGGPDGVDPDYPYDEPDSCKIDNRDLTAPETHFGFDINSLYSIRPDWAADLMSYGSFQPYIWTSDYTWKAIIEHTCPGGVLCPINPFGSGFTGKFDTAASADLSAMQTVVIASGSLIPSKGQGSLNYAWSLPSESISEGIIQKWQNLAAPQVGSSVETNAAQPSYHLRLVAGNGTVLDDWAIELLEESDAPEDAPEGSNFILTFPAPSGEVARLQLMIDDTVVDELQPGPNAPEVTVSQPTGGEVLDEGITVVWQASDVDGDMLLFTVQYSPDLGQTWYALATDVPGVYDSDRATLTLDSLNGIPGSESNRALVRVIASDGYHTTLAQSRAFTVQDRAPQAYIASPAPGRTFLAGQAILLRGSASDIEDGSLEGGDLEWRLDGQVSRSGREHMVAGLAPGSYEVGLTARDSAGQEQAVSAVMNVAPLEIPLGDSTPALDGRCDDLAYESSQVLQLSTYADGVQVSVYLLRSGDNLWVCFSGLERGSSLISFAGLHLDVDHSQEGTVQSDDYGFFVGEDGAPIALVGDGSGGWDNTGVESLSARVSASETVWWAELRLDSTVLGGWEHTIGLDVGHYDVQAAEDGYQWPYATDPTQPDTWAHTVLGEWPQIENLEPEEAASGEAGFSLTVNGSGFAAGATVHWDGVDRPTTVVSSTQVTAEIDTADLSTPGQVAVTVVNPGLEESPSNAHVFSINNPGPTITNLNPGSIPSGSTAFTLTIDGEEFVEGAKVMWNGIEQATTFISSNQLEVEISAGELTLERSVSVSVFNPGPGGGNSNVMTFTILPAGRVIYLPLVGR